MIERLYLLLDGFNIVVLIYFVLINGTNLALTLVAYRELRRYSRRLRSVDVNEIIAAAGAPPVSLIAPAFNEEATCKDAVRSLLSLEYPEYEVIVVNDGSRDKTLQVLSDAFDLVPAARTPTAQIPSARIRGIYRSRHQKSLWVIDKENGGKADALNAGINHCRTPYFCSMDADTLLERDALARIIRPFLEDRHTVAAGGIIRIVNDCTVSRGVVEVVRLPRNPIAAMQVLEYLRAFLSARMGWGALRSMLIISGAFGVFRRAAVVEVGGYWTDTVGEDMELVVRLHRHFREKEQPYRIAFVPDPVAWTECPESLKILGRQRDRWQRGLYQTLSRHRKMMFNPKYGVPGVLAFPYFFFLEMLGPVVEVLGYFTFALAFVLGRYEIIHALAFVSVAIAFGIANSIAAIALEELTFRRYQRLGDVLRLMWLSIAENFGYRQLSTYWRMRGLMSARKAKKGWGAMVRKGFDNKTAALVMLPLLFGSARVAHAQAASWRWQTGAAIHHEAFAGDDAPADWQRVTGFVEHRGSRGTVRAEVLRAERFDLEATALALDAHPVLNAKTYANVRAQISVEGISLPEYDAALEIFRAFAPAMELSAGIRRLAYEGSDAVDIASLGLAHYAGAWFIRPRVSLIRHAGRTAMNGGLLARRYQADALEFVELSVSHGSEAVTVAAEPVIDLRATNDGSARIQQKLTNAVGGSIGVTYAIFEGTPARWGIRAGVFYTF